MVSRGSTLEWHVPCAPCCLKIYIVTNLFLRLAHVSQFYSTTLVCSLVSYLRPIGRVSPFILRDFTIKSLYIEKQIRQLLPLRIRHRNSSALRISFTQLRDIIAFRPSPFVAPRFSLLLSFARHLLRCTAPYRTSLLNVSYQILFRILFIIFSCFTHSSHRLLKKGLTSPRFIFHFAGSSHCKRIILEPTARVEFSEFLRSRLTHHPSDAQVDIAHFETKSAPR